MLWMMQTSDRKGTLAAMSFNWHSCMPRWMAALSAVAGIVLVSQPVSADAVSADSVQPLKLEVSLVNDTIQLGEPVVLRYRVTNPNPTAAAFFLGNEGRRWLSLSLVNAAQPQNVIRLEPPLAPVTRQSHAGEYRGGSVASQGAYEGLLVLSRWLMIPQAGKYTLTLEAQLPYAAASGPKAIVSPLSAEKSGTAVEKEAKLTLVVKAADPTYLQNVAESFRNKALGTDPRKQQEAFEQLFSMRGPEALANWKRLANDPRLDVDGSRLLFQQLRDMEGRDTQQLVDFLGWMVWSSRQQTRWSNAKSWLVEIYRNSSDTVMKRRIERLFQRNEGSSPENIPTMHYDS